jgi:hypothetical protein
MTDVLVPRRLPTSYLTLIPFISANCEQGLHIHHSPSCSPFITANGEQMFHIHHSEASWEGREGKER